MEDYLTEREQIEQVRGWFKENAPWAIAGLVIGVGMIVGYQQYQAWRERQAQTANQKYAELLDMLGRADQAGATRLVAELRADYARTPYADLGELGLARFEVESNQLVDAEKHLDSVMQTSRDPELRVIARLRLARVQRADGKPDVALATLTAAPTGADSPAYAEARGDALADKGDRNGALAAWGAALAGSTEGTGDRDLLELKIASLGGAPPAAKPAAAPAAAGAKP
ncbi:MAG TPA: tetratricopeptide repeat protein [Steroidobacteraceae bacterium]|nr:tetratricopeptide repeat protein [Steroidobacteraceae bacterium]